MEIEAIAQAVGLMDQKQSDITEADKEFILQFAIATSDKELTGKLISELSEMGADKGHVYRKYQTLTGFRPNWIRKVETLLAFLEIYSIQEEKAVKALSEFLAAYGVPLTADEEKAIMMGSVMGQHGENKEVPR